jgi:hypothetical protein
VGWRDEEIATVDDYLADFASEFESLCSSRAQEFADYLRPGPIPQCYQRPQRLAAELLAQGSNGILYPSVRRRGGRCLACFRPALVYHVRRGARLELRLKAGRRFTASHVREIPIPA